MTAYVGADVVYGPIKMVNGSDEKPTVVGTFHVYHKRELQTMRGSNADGTKYETPDVPYISYFHRGFALHGAPWRSSFGYAGEPVARTAASTCPYRGQVGLRLRHDRHHGHQPPLSRSRRRQVAWAPGARAPRAGARGVSEAGRQSVEQRVALDDLVPPRPDADGRDPGPDELLDAQHVGLGRRR